MGKLLSGHYGRPPEAESVPLSLTDAGVKLGLKPSDFVSQGAPTFFEKAFGTSGRYLLFLADDSEVKDSPVWKSGYYLLPLSAADVLEVLEKNKRSSAMPVGPGLLPVRSDEDAEKPPLDVQGRLDEWLARAQPLFFKCKCDYLELKVHAPWGLRRRWKARLRCPNRCQPVHSTTL